MLRRSGVAVGMVACALNDWKADWFFQVGVGQHHQEIDVLIEEWGLKHGQIVCFEADTILYKKIKKDFPGTLVNVAVSDVADLEVPFYHKKKHQNGSSLYPFIRDEETTTITVKTNTLDNILTEQAFDLSKRVLLWIDCEGHELNVLKGAEKLLKNVDLINIEMTMSPPGEGWSDSEEVHWWLMDHGFYRMWIHTHRIESGQYDGIYASAELFDPSKCCCPHTIREWKRSC